MEKVPDAKSVPRTSPAPITTPISRAPDFDLDAFSFSVSFTVIPDRMLSMVSRLIPFEDFG
jgi:hypothetical protein